MPRRDDLLLPNYIVRLLEKRLDGFATSIKSETEPPRESVWPSNVSKGHKRPWTNRFTCMGQTDSQQAVTTSLLGESEGCRHRVITYTIVMDTIAHETLSVQPLHFSWCPSIT